MMIFGMTILTTIGLLVLGISPTAAAEDTYCSGARYAVGQPFVDITKLNPHPGSLTNLGGDPIAKIGRIRHGAGVVRRTIGYVYYNRRGLADLAPAPEAFTTPADKSAFREMLARIGALQPPPSTFMPSTQLGDGVIRFFAGTKLKKALGADNSVAACLRSPASK